jgi:CHAT domain-containing protein/predicted negative regulator of RcsB-dependent stress response
MGTWGRAAAVLGVIGVCWAAGAMGAPADDAAARKTLDQLIDALTRQEREAYEALWDRDAPRRHGRHGVVGVPRVRNIKVLDWEVHADRAVARLTLEEATSGEEFAPVERVVRLVRRADVWKVWSFVSPADDLIDTLSDTADITARKELLVEKGRLLTPAGIHELNRRTFQRVAEKDEPGAQRAAATALEAATTLGDVPTLAWARLHGGYVYERQGKGEEARAEYEPALETFRATGEQQGEAMARLCLGRVLAARKEFAIARPHFEAARELVDELSYGVAREERVAGLAAHTFELLDRQAELDEAIRKHLDAGELEDAHHKREEILKVELELFGPWHNEVAGTRYFEALIQAQRGNLSEANAAAERAVAIREAVMGPQHWKACDARLDLALHHRLAELTAEQRGRYWEAYRGQRASLPQGRAGKWKETLAPRRRWAEVTRELIGETSREHGRAVYSLGFALAQIGEIKEAEDLVRQAWDILEPLVPADSPDVVNAVDELCLLLEKRANKALAEDDVVAARRHQQEILSLKTQAYGKKHHEILEPRWQLEHILRLADLTPQQRRRVHQARETLAKADKPTPRKGPDPTLLTEVERTAADLAALLGADDYQTYRAQHALYLLHVNSGLYQQARRDHPRLRAWLEKQGAVALGHPTYRNWLEDAGHLAFMLRDVRQAQQHFNDAVKLFHKDKAEGTPRYANVVMTLAFTYEQLGELEEEIHLLFGLLQQYKEKVFGVEARGMGKGRAPRLRLGGSKPTRDQETLAQIYAVIGDLYIRKNRPDQAEVVLQESLRINQAFGDDKANRCGQILQSLASIQQSRKNFAEAEKTLDRAAELLGDSWSMRRNRGGLLMHQGKFAAAHVELLEALKFMDRMEGEGSVRCLGLLGDLVFVEAALGLPEALDHVLQALALEQKLFRQLPAYASEGQMQTFLADTNCLDHLLSMALTPQAPARAREQALSWMLRRKGLILETLCRLREDWMLVEDDPALADRAARLQQLRKETYDLSLRGSGDPAAARRLTLLRREADGLEAELLRVLTGKRPERFRAVDEIDLAGLRRCLPAGAVLVEFVRYTPFDDTAKGFEGCWRPARYAAFVVRAEADAPVDLIDLGEVAAIDKQVSELRKAIDGVPEALARGRHERSLEAEYRQLAQGLYEVLLGRLRGSLGDAGTWLLSPDGVLHGVPFEALVDGEKYLVEKVRVGYVVSGRDLLRPPPATLGRGTVIFADPAYQMSASQRLNKLPALATRKGDSGVALRGPIGGTTRGGHRPLEYTRDEAKDIAAVLKGSRWGPVRPLLLGADALEERLKDLKWPRSPRLLHLATHGFYFEKEKKSGETPRGMEGRIEVADNPLLRSGLLLAGADATDQVPEGSKLEDGWVTAEEVAQLDLRGTDLVVLSTCVSGLGDVKSGEGVYGLRRAFFYAGVRTLVVSLFSVPDRETRPLMKTFYSRLAAGKGKLEALHEAQMEILQERRKQNHGTAHPFFWASFILIGDAG